MSMNSGAKNVDRGKRSPVQKFASNKRATVTKTETSKRESKPSCSTIDKYFIKRPAAEGSEKTNNNNIREPNSKSTAGRKLEEKRGDSIVLESDSPEKSKYCRESSPESDIIVVDEVCSAGLDQHSSPKANGCKEKHRKSDPEGKLENKSINKEGKKHSDSASETASDSEQKKLQDQKCRLKTKSDDGNSTDGVLSESETETQEYDIDRFEDARVYVDYKEEDFNTDSDFEKSDTEQKEKEEVAGSKRKNTEMGNFFSRRSRKEACQGSSSEDDEGRPWRPSTRPPEKKKAKQYSLRSPRLAPLKRHWSDHDTQQYRAGYPDKRDDPNMNLNLQFYQGKIPSKPDGAFIDDFHKHWWKNHDRLESHHGYIQWLFPIRESGMNMQAQELQLHEAKAIRNDAEMRERFVKSYEMMLYFYGIRMVEKNTGQVQRADNWQPRFRHLNHSMHNYLRITRILKCLGEMGFEHYKAPLLEFMLREAIGTGKLDRTLDSCCNYWVGTIKNDQDREKLQRRAEASIRGTSSRR